MGLFSRLFGESHNDEPERLQERAARKWLRDSDAEAAAMGMDVKVRLCTCGDTVTWADAAAPFGESAKNPIPVNAIEGTFAYLNRLHSINGKHYLFHRLRSVDEPRCGGRRLDRYELLRMDGTERRVVFIDMYCTRRSRLAPRDMSLEPFPRAGDPESRLMFMPMTGTNMQLADFPYDLPDAICSHQIALGFPPRLAHGARQGMAELIERIAPRTNDASPRRSPSRS